VMPRRVFRALSGLKV
ncbi:hypothetical protein, partial [Clostridioides difficile]